MSADAIVPRGRVVESFSAAAHLPVTLVNAPAGYGKTIAARAFLDTRDDPVAYVDFGRRDDRESSWFKLTNAVAAADAAPDALAAIQEFRDPAYASSGERSSSQPLIAVLDGLDRIDDARVVEELGIFINRMPPAVRIVAIAERKVALPVARWRAQGRLADIGPDDLRFDYAEAAAFFASRGSAPAPADVETLTDRAEGWPLGLDLLADPLKESAVVRKVLDSHPPDLQELLVQTSVLAAFDADLCRAVTGRDDAGELLRQAAEANIFLVAIEDKPGWFRYRRLFAELMRTELDRREPGRQAELRRRAAAWLRDHGELQAALRHLVAAGRVEEAFEIANEDVYRPRVAHGSGRVDWETIFPPGWISADASRMVQFATLLGRSGSLDQAQTWIDRAERAVDAVPVDDPRHATLLAAQALWHGIHLDLDKTIALGEPALAAIPVEDWSRPMVQRLLLVLTHARIALDDLDAAEQHIAQLDGITESAAVRDLVVPSLQAQLALLHGHLRQAEEIARRTLRAADTMGLGLHPAVFDAHRAVGELLVERSRPDDAVPHIEAAADSLDTLGWTVLAAHARLGLVRACAVREGPVAALAVLADIRRSLDGTLAGPGALAAVDLLDARLRLAAHDPDGAERLTSGLPSGLPRALLDVRLCLARGDAAGAAAQLDDLPPVPLLRDRIVARLLAARAAAQAGRAADRDRALLEAAQLGWPESFVTVFVEEAPELLRRTRELVRREADLPGAAPARPVESMIEAPLTERERDVLRYLPSELTHQEIAGHLGISANTVKSHVRGLYRKLGVASRGEAVSAARLAGLL